MRKAFIAAIAAILIVSMSSCGYIGGEQTPTETTTTTELTIPTIVHSKIKIISTIRIETIYYSFKYWNISYWYQRLGKYFSKRIQPCSLSASYNNDRSAFKPMIVFSVSFFIITKDNINYLTF